MTDESSAAPRRGGGLARTLAVLALVAGLVAVLLVGGAGPGTRLGIWSFITALRQVLKWGAYLGIATIVLALAALLTARGRAGRRTMAVAVVALLLGLVAWYFPWSWRRHARSVPPIHDITTDFVNPPQLVQSKALRDTSSQHLNTADYPGDSVAALQRKAYPDVRPVMLAMKPDEAWAAVYRTARDMGWEDIDANRAEGRVEAVAVTQWFGFKDDVVIRVTPASGISRVDIRSVSRVGGSDIGMNAARIRKFTQRLKQNYPRQVAEAG
jgi:uncharacterized protein (DUF1499 family)